MVLRLIFWSICYLIDVLFRMLIGDTFRQAMLNILTIMPLIWVVNTVGEIAVCHFSRKERL
ncbi:hypothetical protein CHT97_11000 [Lacticaseibacillus chiayiensis]|nr:hypothetical protein CHT97_11000 [Lacticaseibacillus chiayiensis]